MNKKMAKIVEFSMRCLNNPNKDIKLLKIKLISPMIKINFAEIFNTEESPQHNITKQFETEAGSVSGNEPSVDEKYRTNKDDIFIEDQQRNPQNQILNNPQLSNNLIPKDRILPGTRLYFQHQENDPKKMLDCERKHVEKRLQDESEFTYRPKLNQHSLALLERKSRNSRESDYIINYSFLETMLQTSKKQIQKERMNKTATVFERTLKKKEIDEFLQCTFTPELISKPTANGRLRQTAMKQQPSRVYEHLYNNFKAKEFRKRVQEEAEVKYRRDSRKILSQAQLGEFLMRNGKFIEKRQKKVDLVGQFIHTHDLESGARYFQPKLNKAQNQRYSQKRRRRENEVRSQSLDRGHPNSLRESFNENSRKEFGAMGRNGISLTKIQQHQGQHEHEIYNQE